MKNPDEYEILERAHEAAGVHMMQKSPRAEELIACLEGEIAKRDEELAACRVAVENCEVFRARIAELESQFDGESIVCGSYRDERDAALAELAAIKAQGVVQWPEADEIMQMAFEEGHPADDASGYYFELEEFDLFIERLMSEVARLTAAPVQQVSVPDWWKLVPVEPTEAMRKAAQDKLASEGLIVTDWLIHTAYSAMLAAAPAAPAADAGLSLAEWEKDANEWGGALNYAAWEFVNECPEKSALLFNNTKGPLRAAIMKYAEIVAANAKDSSHD